MSSPPPPRSPPQPPASPGPGRGVLTGRASAPSSSAVRCPVPTAAARALPPGSAPEGEGEAAGAERSGAAALRTRPPAPAIDFLKQLQLWHFLTSKHTHTHTDAHTHTHSARSRALHRHPEPLSGVCGQHRHQHPNPSCILHQVQDPAPALCTQHLCNPALHAPYSDILHRSPLPAPSTVHPDAGILCQHRALGPPAPASRTHCPSPALSTVHPKPACSTDTQCQHHPQPRHPDCLCIMGAQGGKFPISTPPLRLSPNAWGREGAGGTPALCVHGAAGSGVTFPKSPCCIY